MNANGKQVLTVSSAIIVIIGSCLWIYFTQFHAPKFNEALHRRVGEVMAQETAAALNHKGKVVVITIPTRGEPELHAQLDAFYKTLGKLGAIHVKEDELDTKDQPKYGAGMGLSGRRYVRIVHKNVNADAIVSFVGAPKLSDEDIAQLTKAPRFIAEARSVDHLPELFQKGFIWSAVASRFQFPAPGPLTPKTGEEWFNKRYQVVRSESASRLPKPE